MSLSMAPASDAQHPTRDQIDALGDVAATDPLRGSARNRADRLLARNIRRHLAGRPLRPYRPRRRRWGSVLGFQPDGLRVFTATGQGASLAIESAIQLARCLRDYADVTAAFAAYEGLRRARVERITKRGARINHAKTPGPVGRAFMQLMMPLMFKAMKPEKLLGAEQRYTIDWDAAVQSFAEVAG